MILARIQKRLLTVLLLFSLSCAAFTYGVAVGVCQIFPYDVLQDARTAALALIELAKSRDDAAYATAKRPVFAPRVHTHIPLDSRELLLISGGPGYMKEYYPDGCVAWLMNRAGEVQHTWRYDPAVWKELKTVTYLHGVSGEIYPVGLHLYDNGDLLVSYQGKNTFPFAIGMALLDKDSKLRWKQELLTHHWFSVAEDGRIFTPSMRVVSSPVQLGTTQLQINSDTGKIYSDSILVLDPKDGHVLSEIMLLDALIASGWGGLFTPGGLENKSDDPLHLNDVQLVPPHVAQDHPWLSAGDLLVSFRSLNAVGILDPETARFKWVSAGTTVAQHSPRFYDGGVLILDNAGGSSTTGGTQLVKIDLERGTPTRLFPLPEHQLPEDCATADAGHLDVHAEGARVLMALTRRGSVWEVNPRTGEVAWEYIYVHPQEGASRQPIFTAKYVYQASFLSKGTEE